ncbi:hypothetical protein HA48_19535 [Pantoea wallisii]|uniref:Rad50/SbcC-type AAA domain-containing protein n=2 Tax=Pantoea wallisii TaxID=1076551 RepID=A0A1X1CXK8_9GAMM|nr:hypothetical protein HA48_19535 [Pantoea wallisii]
MFINAIKYIAKTIQGDFGFYFTFDKGLNIIRADNSSGKSTVISSIYYALGLEEIIGGRGLKTLNSALKDSFKVNGNDVKVISSKVFIEIGKSNGEFFTSCRHITSDSVDTKLFKVYMNEHLSKNTDLIGEPIFKFIHDAGGANSENGFHLFLEKFLGLELPEVLTNKGDVTKLYLQCIFASMFIEQKRGWTDYIANTPYYAIRDAKKKVVEYVLNLDTFKSEFEKEKLKSEFTTLITEWKSLINEIKFIANSKFLSFNERIVTPSEYKGLVSLSKSIDGTHVTLSDYKKNLLIESREIKSSLESEIEPTSEEITAEITIQTEKIEAINFNLVSLVQDKILKKHESVAISKLEKEISEDIKKTKSLVKLKKFGAEINIHSANDFCPVCSQKIDDNLVLIGKPVLSMDVEDNILYLETQKKMLNSQSNAISKEIEIMGRRELQLRNQFSMERRLLTSLKEDIKENRNIIRYLISKQVNIDSELESLNSTESSIKEIEQALNSLSAKIKENREKWDNLPSGDYSSADIEKIMLFAKLFRSNASSFDYSSADIEDIEINAASLLPTLEKVELREIIDVKNESSASDFVRLIWAYIIALYQAKKYSTGNNHIGVLIFDEPGQHSMSIESQRSLLNILSHENNLQSIVAASFDESENNFITTTRGLEFKYINWDGKVISSI